MAGLIRAALVALALAAVPAAAEPPRILAFGDSLTAGFGLRRGEGLVPQLQAWLDARGIRATVIDGGLSGDTTFGGRIRLPYAIARHDPDAVIVELGANDMLLRLDPALTEGNLDALLGTAAQGDRPVLLVGIGSPSRVASVRRRWADMWPRLAQRHDALLLQDLYAPLAAIPRHQLRAYLLADGLHPSPQGIELIVQALGPKVAQLVAQVAEKEAAGAD